MKEKSNWGFVVTFMEERELAPEQVKPMMINLIAL